MMSKLQRQIERARRMGRIKDGKVLCENCDTPASKSYTRALSWICCGPCATGEAAEFNPKDLIYVQEAR